LIVEIRPFTTTGCRIKEDSSVFHHGIAYWCCIRIGNVGNSVSEIVHRHSKETILNLLTSPYPQMIIKKKRQFGIYAAKSFLDHDLFFVNMATKDSEEKIVGISRHASGDFTNPEFWLQSMKMNLKNMERYRIGKNHIIMLSLRRISTRPILLYFLCNNESYYVNVNAFFLPLDISVFRTPNKGLEYLLRPEFWQKFELK
jgi:hypothetical protein